MILVTGATGFIGRAVVARLVDSGEDVAVLARRRNLLDAHARVAAALGEDAAGVRVVEGDLAADGAGLAPGDRRWLGGLTDTVIHCAGDTSFVPTAAASYLATHVDGPVALLRALAGGRLTRWAHLSTAYVCGTRQGTVRENEREAGQTFHNVYEPVKLRAEMAIRAAGSAAGVDVRVLRPSIVVGAAPATAGGTPSNLFFAFIRLMASLARWSADTPLRIEGAPEAPFNIVPLNYVAAATATLALRPEAAGGTFHLVVRDAPRQVDMLGMLVERLGLEGLRLVDARRDELVDPSPLERRVARMLGPYRAYLTQDVRFDDTVARAVLADCGVPPPALAADDVRQLVDLALVSPTPARV
jgi:nucleoside-diphosphate-sugar epimerase